MNELKKLYHWVLHWAETPYGPVALFTLAFVESSVFPLPPDILLIALALGIPRKSFWFATICTAGSVIGGLFGYLIGYQFWNLVGDFFLNHIFSVAFFMRVQEYYHANAFLAVFTSGFTPIPYKVFTISAGVFRLPLLTFVSASLLGRSLRFFLVAILLFLFGARVERLIEKYFEWFTVVFGFLLVGGFIFVKHFLH